MQATTSLHRILDHNAVLREGETNKYFKKRPFPAFELTSLRSQPHANEQPLFKFLLEAL